MALVLTFKTEPNNSADRMWITDQTGEYDAVANPEGWGDPPPGDGHDLNQSALVAMIIRNFSVGPQRLLAVSQDSFHNPGGSNATEVSFEFYYVNDGTHDMHLWRLPVSADGMTDLETLPLVNGDYYYNSSLLGVYHITAEGDVLVTDYTELIGITQTSVVETLCQDIFSGLEMIERAEEYRKYQSARQGNAAEDPLFMDAMETTMDVISSEYTFRSGLLVDAQNQVETLLDEKDIDDVNPSA